MRPSSEGVNMRHSYQHCKNSTPILYLVCTELNVTELSRLELAVGKRGEGEEQEGSGACGGVKVALGRGEVCMDFEEGESGRKDWW